MKTLDKVLIGAAATSAALGFGFPFIVKHCIFINSTFADLGTVGDWFGGLSTPLIGLSSFILVYLAFRLQVEQNKQQRIEFVKQNKILSLQRFENSFFQLLTFHNKIVQTLPREEDLNREYFHTVYLMMLHNLGEIKRNAKSLSKEMTSSLPYKESVAIDNYSTVFNKEQALLGHYFRHLYHIVKYIHKSNLIDEEEKKHYAALLRAHLSSYELVLLLYNCLVESLGYPKFKYLADKYDLLHNMNRNLLLDPSDFEVFQSKLLEENCLND